MIATLQLNDFFAESFSFESNQFYDPTVREGRLPGQIECSFEVSSPQEEGKHPYLIVFEVSVNPAKERPAHDPYAIKFRIVGFFTLSGNPPAEEKDRLLSLNGGTILYGIIRGIVAQATGNGPFGKYIMPAINLVEIYEKRKQQTLSVNKPDMKKEPSQKRQRKKDK